MTRQSNGRQLIPLMTFLYEKCEHHFEHTVIPLLGNEIFGRKTCNCPICAEDLIKWVNRDELVFEFKCFDGRTAPTEPENEFLFESYEKEVALKPNSETRKANFKAAIRRSLDKLVELSDQVPAEERSRVKRYQFKKMPYLRNRVDRSNAPNWEEPYEQFGGQVKAEGSIPLMEVSNPPVHGEVYNYRNHQGYSGIVEEPNYGHYQRGRSATRNSEASQRYPDLANQIAEDSSQSGISFQGHGPGMNRSDLNLVPTRHQNKWHYNFGVTPPQLPRQTESQDDATPVYPRSQNYDDPYKRSASEFRRGNPSTSNEASDVSFAGYGNDQFSTPQSRQFAYAQESYDERRDYSNINHDGATADPTANGTMEDLTELIEDWETFFEEMAWNPVNPKKGVEIYPNPNRGLIQFKSLTQNQRMELELFKNCELMQMLENSEFNTQGFPTRKLAFKVYAKQGRLSQTLVLHREIVGNYGGFRILPGATRDGEFVDVSNAAIFGPESIDGKQLESVYLTVDNVWNDGNKNVQKAMQTFESGALVFWWEQYQIPSSESTSATQAFFGHPDFQWLCFRLYCRRRCRGYTKEADPTRLAVLPMCYKAPFDEVHSPLMEYREPQDVLVFDLLQTFVRTLEGLTQLGAQPSRQAFEELQRKSHLHVGLKSSLSADSKSIHVRFEISSCIIDRVLTEVTKMNHVVDDTASIITETTNRFESM